MYDKYNMFMRAAMVFLEPRWAEQFEKSATSICRKFIHLPWIF